MKKTEKKNKSSLIALLLVLVIAIIVLASYAWARYTTIKTNSSTAAVARWDVALTPDNDHFITQYPTLVEANKIAPGTSGTLTFTVSDANTDVAYDYLAKIANINNKPVNLHFYNADNTEIVFTKSSSSFNAGSALRASTSGNTIMQGHVASNSSFNAVNSGDVITINWVWPYQTDTLASGALNTLASEDSRYNTAIKNNLNEEITKNGGTRVADVTAEGVTVTSLKTALTSVAPGADSAAKEAYVNKVINDAIDTVDSGLGNMTFDVVFEATQSNPTPNPNP